jgi:hypothetical protein
MQETLPGITDLPQGFRYKPNLIDIELECYLIERMRDLDFAPWLYCRAARQLSR